MVFVLFSRRGPHPPAGRPSDPSFPYPPVTS